MRVWRKDGRRHNVLMYVITRLTPWITPLTGRDSWVTRRDVTEQWAKRRKVYCELWLRTHPIAIKWCEPHHSLRSQYTLASHGCAALWVRVRRRVGMPLAAAQWIDGKQDHSVGVYAYVIENDPHLLASPPYCRASHIEWREPYQKHWHSINIQKYRLRVITQHLFTKSLSRQGHRYFLCF